MLEQKIEELTAAVNALNLTLSLSNKLAKFGPSDKIIAPPAADEIAEVVEAAKKSAATKRDAATQHTATAEAEGGASGSKASDSAVNAKDVEASFRTLANTDRESAIGLLAQFGVGKFSLLPAEKLGAFAKAISKLSS